ncbi:MAG: pilus assembly protein PilP [Thermoanaerobaculia bacterium]|nr:pilus assembly protein PilP [Thermoanaerobaculia bacterium]
MNRRPEDVMRQWTLAVALLATMAAVAGAQGEAPPAVETPTAPSAEDTARIDEMLEEDEAVLQGIVSTYDPGSRRDPFRSLLAAAPRPELRGPRPEGVAGLLIDEIDLRGIFKTSKGFVAQVQAQNEKKSFLLRPGDQVYDGDVLRIDISEVVFRQIVNDPTVIKPFREVVKKLRP